MTKEFVVYCIAINIIALVTMVYDKIAAIRRDWRVSEQTLLILAVIGGVF
jgi:uncharacterized membrane protein YsdA (DUF1294 family)